MEELNTFVLTTGFSTVIFTAYIVAWFYRNDYSIRKSVRLYIILAGILSLLSLNYHLHWILVIALFLFGLIVLIFRNQHYFDKG